MLTEKQIRGIKPLRYSRKVTDGRGLYLLVAANGGRYWRYDYRFDGRRRTLALGVYPDIPLDSARARHQAARCLMAKGIAPLLRKRKLRTS